MHVDFVSVLLLEDILLENIFIYTSNTLKILLLNLNSQWCS